MWQTRTIEILVEQLLIKELGEVSGKEYFSNYINARKDLIENLLEEIKSKLPSMTDHGPRHIANVLDNAEKLLGKDIERYSSIELYCLITAILFHDVGNIYGRDRHNKLITKIYNIVRKNDLKFSQERFIISKIAEAHCGLNSKNETDTLDDVLQSYHLDGSEVRMQELAAILRLADELAEGIQRTSLYWNTINPHHYEAESQIFHSYAKITNIHIDPGNFRISLAYNIELTEHSEESFKELMEFIYKRIVKLNVERKYCKFYNDSLNKFKLVQAKFNFTNNGDHLDYQLEDIVLDEKNIPGELNRQLTDYNPKYITSALWGMLNIVVSN